MTEKVKKKIVGMQLVYAIVYELRKAGFIHQDKNKNKTTCYVRKFDSPFCIRISDHPISTRFSSRYYAVICNEIIPSDGLNIDEVKERIPAILSSYEANVRERIQKARK